MTRKTFNNIDPINGLKIRTRARALGVSHSDVANEAFNSYFSGERSRSKNERQSLKNHDHVLAVEYGISILACVISAMALGFFLGVLSDLT